MTLPAFIEVQFPTSISYNSAGGPEFSTTIVGVKSGFETRNINWPQSRAKWNVAYGVRNISDLEQIIYLHQVCQGRAIGFRFKDWTDYKSCVIAASPNFTDQQIGISDGVTQNYQLTKTYTFGGQTTVRKIVKPVAGTVAIGVNGANYATQYWSVDTTKGMVHFNAVPAAGAVITAGFQFDTPARFDTDHLSLTLPKPQLANASIPVIEDLNQYQ